MAGPPGRRSVALSEAGTISDLAGVSKGLGAAAILVAAALLAIFPGSWGVTPSVGLAAALCFAAIAFWGTGILPEPVTAMGFFLVAMLLEVAPPGVVFAGFSSTAFWLVVGGLIIGVAVKRSGLGDWLAGRMVGVMGRGYAGMIAGIVLIGVVLSFLMPSTMGRVLIIVPIVISLADRYGFPEGSRGRNAMVLAMALGTFMPAAAILPSNVANMVLAGAAETIHGITLTYGTYLIQHFPVLGILKAILVVATTLALLRDRPRATTGESGTLPDVTLSPEGRRVALILLGALVFWVTDELHGVSPAWVALAAALLCVLPGVGVLSSESLSRDMNTGPIFYVAGMLGMGTMLATQGVSDVLGQFVVDFLPFGADTPFRNFMTLSALVTVLGTATAVPGLPAVMTPIAGDIAAASGFTVETVLMISVVGFANIILPYQLPPLVVAMQLARVRLRDAARLTVTLAVLSYAILVPLLFVWWRLLGYL